MRCIFSKGVWILSSVWSLSSCNRQGADEGQHGREPQPVDAQPDARGSDAGAPADIHDAGAVPAGNDASATARVADAAMGSGAFNPTASDDAQPPGPISPNQSCVAPSPPFSDAEQQLVALPPDSWFEVPDSVLERVCPEELTSCGNVVDPWSSGVFDAVNNQVLVFGGGHMDYAGNEVYAFALESLSWTRLTDPSDSAAMNQDPLPDGRPVSRHTYDGLSFITHAGRMFAHGGSRWQDGSGTDVSWTFDPAAGEWENRQPPNDPDTPYCCGEASAYDPKSKRVYFHLIQSLVAYDFDANEWVELEDYGNAPFWPRYEAWGYKRGLVDTKRDLLWFLGGDLLLVYDIDGATHVTDDWVMTGGAEFTNAELVGDREDQLIITGGGEVISAPAPGADYDTAADDIVAWVGGAPWILDLDSKHWSRSEASGGPDEPSSRGTYGRFRYVPRLNVFLLINGSAENVWVYKHSAGCGQ